MLKLLKKKKVTKKDNTVIRKADFSNVHVNSEDTVPTAIDFLAPSFLKETSPSDLSMEGVKVGDYFVEIGGTTEFVRYYRTFYAEITGGSTYAGMFDNLYRGDFGQGALEADIDIGIHIDPVDTSTELDNVASRIRSIKSDLYREMPDEKRDKLRDELGDLEERQRRLRQNLEKAFRASIQILISSNDLKSLKRFSNLVIRRFAGNQIVLRSPDGNQLEAFFNMTPLRDTATYKEHTFSYETSNLADMFPLGNGKISHTDGIIWGRDNLGRPIFYNAWNRTLMNRNAVIMGGSGAGKTNAALKLIHHDTLRGVRHAIICPKGDYRRYVEDMGCPYIDLGEDSPDRINFFDVDIEEQVTKDGIVKRVNIESTVAAARAIIYKMIRLLDENVLTGIVKTRIDKKIRELYKKAEISADPNSLFEEDEEEGKVSITRKLKPMPQIGDLYKLLNKDKQTKEIAELLKNYTRFGDSPSEAIFDHQSTVKLRDTPLFGFGLADLDEERMKPLGLFIATKWLSTKFAHKDRHIQKRVVVDEAQIPMEDEETARWLENEFRVVRFFNTSMIAITQGVEVFMRSKYGLGILKNAPTKLFLKQDSIDIKDMQEKFNLTAFEARFLIDTAGEGLGILRINEERSTIQVTLSPYESMLFETDPNKMAAKRDAYYESIRK
jgi:type IV secretory pathway VirB4 component